MDALKFTTKFDHKLHTLFDVGIKKILLVQLLHMSITTSITILLLHIFVCKMLKKCMHNKSHDYWLCSMFSLQMPNEIIG